MKSHLVEFVSNYKFGNVGIFVMLKFEHKMGSGISHFNYDLPL